jgi:transposase
MPKRVQVNLSKEEREKLIRFSTTGQRSVRLVNRAKILLELDSSDGRTPDSQEKISEKLGVSRQTVVNARNAYLASPSLEQFLQRKKRATPPVEPKVTGEMEARIIALACSKAPEGRAKWTLRLIADKAVELGYADSLSHMTVSRLLKKRNLSLT